MSNYRRFITYLFQYEAGEKRSQCGYARVEQKQNQGKIDLYIKDCGVDGSEILPCFFAQAGQVQIPIGKIQVKNNVAEASFRFECQQMGDTAYHFSQMRGIVIPLAGNRLILSQWDDEEYQWDALMQNQLVAMEAVEPAPDQRVDTGVADRLNAEQRVDTDVADQRVDTGVADRLNAEQRVDTAVADQRVDTGVADRLNAHQTSTAAQSLELGLRALRPKYYPFHGDLSAWASQSQLRDIKLLPRNYWPLANNSFVLRGYFNYGNILIGYMEAEKSFFIGIPGVFQKQEKVIAGLFGFSRFRGQRSAEAKPGDFGYWYQLVDVV